MPSLTQNQKAAKTAMFTIPVNIATYIPPSSLLPPRPPRFNLSSVLPPCPSVSSVVVLVFLRAPAACRRMSRWMIYWFRCLSISPPQEVC
jgi:hypothetical protein